MVWLCSSHAHELVIFPSNKLKESTCHLPDATHSLYDMSRIQLLQESHINWTIYTHVKR